MDYETIEDWKAEIKRLFREKADCCEEACRAEADAFEEMHGNDWPEVPTPQECFNDETAEWAACS